MAAFSNNNQVYRKYIERISVMYSNRTDIRMFTEIILSLLTVILFGAFAIRPTITTIAELYREIIQKRETVSLLDAKIDSLIAAQALVDERRVDISLLNLVIPDEPLATKYLRQVEGIAKRNGSALTSFSVEDVPVKGAADSSGEVKIGSGENDIIILPLSSQAIFVKFDVVGPYSNALNFLSDIENARRPILFSTTDVTLSTGTFGGGVRLTVSGIISYLNP